MKDIIGYEGKYAVDQQGNVYSHNYRNTGKMKILKGCISKYGYKNILLTKNGKSKMVKAHRLVAQAYLSDYSEDLQVDHIDGDKVNNNLSNLRMVTNQQNCFNTRAKGYSWNKEKQKWQARIVLNGKYIHLGYYDSEDEAREAYLSAKERLHII